MAYQSYSYSGPSYNPPPQQSAYYNPPGPRSYQPPAPSPAPPALAGSYDPFRAYYADRLRELTFNSRPLIQELSVLAMQQRDQNHWGNMTAVVEEIEGAVYRVCRRASFVYLAGNMHMLDRAVLLMCMVSRADPD
jgi:pre-mRNA cleavage complex 2 protein Pcf11